jgi:transposase
MGLRALCLVLIDEQAPQRRHSLREVFNALRCLGPAGAAWRMWLNDLPPWQVVYQQCRRRNNAGLSDGSDRHSVIRAALGRQVSLTPAISTLACNSLLHRVAASKKTAVFQKNCHSHSNAPVQSQGLAAFKDD